jgi:protein MpaA
VGCIHGNEPAGRDIVADLMRASPAPDMQLLLVRDLNPDGFAHHQRTNAHGVDLNRNSPEHWAGAGPRPWSEPEARAIRDLILREQPALSLYYHQPFGLVDVPEGGRPEAARRYSELVGLPLKRLSRRPGSISRWQNLRVRPGSAFVVELAAGPLPADVRLRHVAAALAL